MPETFPQKKTPKAHHRIQTCDTPKKFPAKTCDCT